MGREQSRIGNIIRLFKNGCVSFPVSPSVANPPYKIRRPPYFRCLNWTMLYLLYLLYLDLKKKIKKNGLLDQTDLRTLTFPKVGTTASHFPNLLNGNQKAA